MHDKDCLTAPTLILRVDILMDLLTVLVGGSYNAKYGSLREPG